MSASSKTAACAAIGVLLLGLGCRSRSGTSDELVRDELRVEVLGCYALYDDRGQRVDSSFYNASPLVRLDSAVVGITARDTFPGVVRVLVRLDTAGRRVDRIDSRTQFGPTWSADSLSDSLRLSFVDGFSGAVLTLATPRDHPDTLRGHAEEHWDAGPKVTARGRVYAVRLACPDTLSVGGRAG